MTFLLVRFFCFVFASNIPTPMRALNKMTWQQWLSDSWFRPNRDLPNLNSNKFEQVLHQFYTSPRNDAFANIKLLICFFFFSCEQNVLSISILSWIHPRVWPFGRNLPTFTLTRSKNSQSASSTNWRTCKAHDIIIQWNLGPRKDTLRSSSCSRTEVVDIRKPFSGYN